ncbi:MAG: NAD(P)/FAD-dependent oxidoreductase, partial [Actinomycetota bacterium]|nr:NAD(P)/FAD-dependent oxidoreductase [Actinomycetota bacterium]
MGSWGMAQGRQAAEFDAVVVGAGPNGLAASTTLAAAGASVLVVEGAETVGGGTRSAELTLPGFVHDVCSAIHPLGVASPYLASLPLDRHGLQWAQPEVPLAHALDGGRAATLQRSVEATDEALGEGQHWASVLGPLVQEWEGLVEQLMGPVLRPPVHPLLLGRFGLRALWPAEALARRVLDTEAASALFAGVAAHSITPLHKALTSAPALVLAAAGHAVGWPAAKGGSQWIADAMAAHLVELGGTIETGRPISSLGQLPRSHAVLFDTTPAQLADIAGERLPDRYRRRLRRFRHGSASFKVDYALDGPVPWTASEARRAGTVHVTGSIDQLTRTMADLQTGCIPATPFLIFGQYSMTDPTRQPAGKE